MRLRRTILATLIGLAGILGAPASSVAAVLLGSASSIAVATVKSASADSAKTASRMSAEGLFRQNTHIGAIDQNQPKTRPASILLAADSQQVALSKCLYDASGYTVAPRNIAGAADEALALSKDQAANLKRFNKKLPSGNTGTKIDTVGDNLLFTSEVPGRVPGSKAVYQKTVDSAGNTTSYLKTTFGPDGQVIHIKDKLNGGIIPAN